MDIRTDLINDTQGTRCDYAVAAGSLAADGDLQTSVLLSLFTDRRAEDDDALPDPGGSRRGWWGDAFGTRRLGSRLWLLGREKQLREVVNRAREYAEEALAWLVEEGVASAVTVDAQIVAAGTLGLDITVTRQAAAPAHFRYDWAWSQL